MTSVIPDIPKDGAPVAEVTLEGKYVRLEPLRLTHLEPLLAAVNHPTEKFPFTFVHTDREGLRGYIAEAVALAEKKAAVPFAVIDRADGAVVGTTRFANIELWDWEGRSFPRPRPPGNPDAVEIGWTWLAPRAQRTAINTEQKRLMLGHAFGVWKVSRVTLKTDARNFRSRNAIERIGGKLDGIIRAHMVASDGGIRDTAFFSLLLGEWPAVKAKLDARLER